MTRRKFIEILYDYYKDLPLDKRKRGIDKIRMSLNVMLKHMDEYINLSWYVTPEETKLIRKMDDKMWKQYLKNYTVDEKDFL